jgi:hypothetical protein
MVMRTFSPRISATVPDGWVIRGTIELASQELEARVIASTEQLPPDATLDNLLERHDRMLAEHFPGYHELSAERLSSPSGAPALLRSFTWDPPESPSVGQVQLYVVDRGRGLVVTASAERERFAEIEPALREVVLGVKLEAGAVGEGDGAVMRTGLGPRERTYAAFDAGVLTAGDSSL